MKNIRTFNKIHAFFSSKIGELYETKNGKKIIAGYIKLIKENAVLRKQYNLYTQLEEGVSKYIKENARDEYINEMLDTFSGITKKQLKEANNKLFWFLMDNDVITETENPWAKQTKVLKEGKEDLHREFSKTELVFKCVDYILYEGKKDLSRYIENKKRLGDNLRVKEEKLNENLTPEERIEKYNEMYKGKLTNEEMNLIKSIVYSTKPQSALIEYQKSIISSIDELYKNSDDVELKNKYLQLKEQILFEDYSNIEKVTKLFEFRQTIDDIKNNTE